MMADAMRGRAKLDVREGSGTAASVNEHTPSHSNFQVARSMLLFEK